MSGVIVNITKATDTPVEVKRSIVKVITLVGNTFEDDSDGDLQPVSVPVASTEYDIDGDGDIRPSLA